jgi:small subunit ribosomal protein S9
VSKPLVQATGRRKRAIARVCLRDGSGKVTINGRDITAYLPSELLRMQATEPLRAAC